MNTRKLYQAVTAILAVLSAGLGLYGGSTVFGAPASYPPFSWRHVPTYADLGSYTGFTRAEAKFLATHFSALSIEKGQSLALQKPGEPPNGEAEFLRTARQLKKFNPQLCVLFYWNARRFFPFYQADETLHNTWIVNKTLHAPMVNNTPWALAIRNPWYAGKTQGGQYIMSKPGFQKWWVNVAASMATHNNVDGIFVDGTIPPIGCSPQMKAACLSLVRGLHNKLARLNKPSLILLNGLEDCLNGTGLNVTAANTYFQYSDGAMLEHFEFVYRGDPAGSAPNRVKTEMMGIMAAGKTGKIVVVKAWPNFNWLTPGLNKIPYPALVKRARKDITFPLACFLICAQRYSYFDYSWGYNLNQGSIVLTADKKNVDQGWYPQLKKPLGRPLGEPNIHGYIFTRKFEHASIWVDLSTHQAGIQWK